MTQAPNQQPPGENPEVGLLPERVVASVAAISLTHLRATEAEKTNLQSQIALLETQCRNQKLQGESLMKKLKATDKKLQTAQSDLLKAERELQRSRLTLLSLQRMQTQEELLRRCGFETLQNGSALSIWEERRHWHSRSLRLTQIQAGFFATTKRLKQEVAKLQSQTYKTLGLLEGPASLQSFLLPSSPPKASGSEKSPSAKGRASAPRLPTRASVASERNSLPVEEKQRRCRPAPTPRREVPSMAPPQKPLPPPLRLKASEQPPPCPPPTLPDWHKQSLLLNQRENAPLPPLGLRREAPSKLALPSLRELKREGLSESDFSPTTSVLPPEPTASKGWLRGCDARCRVLNPKRQSRCRAERLRGGGEGALKQGLARDAGGENGGRQSERHERQGTPPPTPGRRPSLASSVADLFAFVSEPLGGFGKAKEVLLRTAASRS